mmetsp:Transcript_1229/g.1441  ORF Transcript_1229/g.1441 Transcript_1229/m.1441 type:complete len:224 (+) Transcript_1229:77-748(+)
MQRFSNSPYVDFVEQQTTLPNPLPGRRDNGNNNRPGHRVRKQTRDVVSGMRFIDLSYSYKYFLFMEDDFELCDHGLEAMLYLINRATKRYESWIVIRASFGLNGILFQEEDIAELSKYLEKHQTRRPPDHLTTEWYAGETEESKEYVLQRTVVAFRYNILHHIGAISTLRKRSRRMEFPGCWHELMPPVVFSVESFDRQQCPMDDMWPCELENEVKQSQFGAV